MARIPSLVDKRSGRELVDTTAHEQFGQYLYERFSSDQVADYVKAYVKINADWAVNELGKPNLPQEDQRPNQFLLSVAGVAAVGSEPAAVSQVIECSRPVHARCPRLGWIP